MNPRYLRQQQVAQLGDASVAKLAGARVLIVGVGGLGSPVASLLTRAGVGHISLIDPDVVELGNLHRQTLYTEDDIGVSKVQAAAARLRRANADVELTEHVAGLAPENAPALIRQHTIVVDAADNFFTSYLLSDLCFQERVPLIAASVIKTNGHLGVFCGTAESPAPSMRAIFAAPPLVAASCDTAGVTGPSVGVMGAYQAQEALKVIMGDESQLLGQLMVLDLWRHSQHIVDFSKAPEPEFYAPLMAESEVMPRDIVLDVRSADEVFNQPRFVLPSRSNAYDFNIPINQLAQRHAELPEGHRIVCVCKSGQRALYAANALSKYGFKDLAVAR